MIYTPYAWLPLASAILLASIAVYAGYYRRLAACRPFRALMWLSSLFSLIFALNLVVAPLGLRVLLLHLIYIPGAFIAPAILIMVVEHTGHAAWITRRRLGALLIVPVVTVILTLTPPLYPLFRHSPQMIVDGSLSNVVFSRGPWYWIYYGYGTVLSICALAILTVSLLTHAQRRQEMLLLILGIIVPFLADILTTLRITPLPGYAWTPLLLACTGVIYGWALLRGQIFTVVPIARGAVMDHIEDLVIVLSTQGQIADFNSAAQVVCGIPPQAIGALVDVLPPAWADLLRCHDREPMGKSEVTVGLGEERHIYDLVVSTINDRRGRPVGHLFILHDVTERKRAEDALREANQSLQAQLAEIQQLQILLREQATHDVLTGLFNRRYMQEILDQSLAHAARERSPLSVMMIDIDHFKKLNDAYGHKAGDMMLQAMGALLRGQTRQMDTACRYGGEEFVVIMSTATLDMAMGRADELRQAFEEMRVEYDSHELQGTISAGVATFPKHGGDSDTLLRAADQALYMAKATGRNRVCAADTALGAASKLLTAP